MKKILFTGGGSAGHVVPNLALMEDLLLRGDVDVCYMGTNGIEKGLISERKIPFYEISCPKFVRGMSLTNLKNNLKIPFALHHAKRQALDGLKTFQPDLIFSKGGYVALPVIAAARKLKIPCFAHESDFSAGLSNRLSAWNCQHIFTSFPETAKKLPHGKYSGPILRKSLFEVTKETSRRNFSISTNEKVLLVFGGGSGSVALNEALRKNLLQLTQRFTILHVCGKGNVVNCNIKKYKQFEFIKDMGAAYACADLVISRAGSGTIFELLSLKKPSLLIPLEGATRGDQKENASYFRKKELCHVLPQSQLDHLHKAIETAFDDSAMQQRLKELQLPNGNAVILQELLEALR